MAKKQVIEINCDAPNCKRTIQVRYSYEAEGWTIVSILPKAKDERFHSVTLDLCPTYSKSILKLIAER